MGTLTATRGLPAAGKTTYAMRRLADAAPGSLVRLNRDEIRWMAHGEVHHLDRTEMQVNAIQHCPLVGLLRSADVIVDDTNLRARSLRRFAELAQQAGAGFEVVDFTHVDVEECVARDAVRPDPHARVGEAVIRDLHARFLAGRSQPLPVPVPAAPLIGRPYAPPAGAPFAVLCDIDGIFVSSGGCHPASGSRPQPGEGVLAALTAAAAVGDHLVLCSARGEAWRPEIEAWLGDAGLAYDELYLRSAGDTRRDAVVKLDMFDLHVRDGYRVRYVLGGRGVVKRAWQSMGLTVFEVANPNHS